MRRPGQRIPKRGLTRADAISGTHTLWAVEFDHQIAGLGEEPGEPGPVSVSALNRPDPQTAVPVRHRDKRRLPMGVGGFRGVFERCAGCVDDGGGVGVFVVSTPMISANMVTAFSFWTVERVDPVQVGGRQTVTGHASIRLAVSS